jgi:hypothetical protein
MKIDILNLFEKNIKVKVFVGLFFLIFFSLLVSISSNHKLKTEIQNLETEVEELNSKIEELNSKIEELETDAEEVKTFDNNVNSSVRYTGSAIESKVDDEFNGWDGNTIVKLSNGSVWQQADYKYQYHYSYRPEVFIYSKNGATYMKVDGTDEVRVNRIK